VILMLMGWKPLSNYGRSVFKDNDKAIIVYPHTSYWDFFIFLLYRSVNMDVMGDFRTLFAIRFFPNWGWFLRGTKCLPIENKQRGQGQTQLLISKLKDISRVQIFMSPKGTSSKAVWRTGYYHLARELKWPIVVCGLDYCNHKVAVFDPVVIDDRPIEPVKLTLTTLFGEIPQLYPENDPDVIYKKPFWSDPSIISDESTELVAIFGILLLSFVIAFLSCQFHTWF